jgi:hypothetical protein
MSLLAYKVLHLLGIFLLFAALGVLTLRAAQGEERSKLASATHGIALLIILVGGFGAMARLGLAHDWRFPLWIWVKLGIWLILGAAPVLARRMPRLATLWWWLFPLLGATSAYFALYKPI